MFTDLIEQLATEKGIKIAQMLKDLELGQGTFSTWKKRGSIPNGEILSKIADYFGVTTDYLLGRSNGDYSDVKVALFGGDGDVTDEMWDEVKQYAEYIKAKYKKGNK